MALANIFTATRKTSFILSVPVILFNASTVKSGGALQVAYSLIIHCKNYTGYRWVFVLSPALQNLFQSENNNASIQWVVLKAYATANIRALNRHQKTMHQLVHQHEVSAVFTVFGPSWWKPKVPHLCGFANGYYLFNESYFIREIVSTSFYKKKKYNWQRALVLQALKTQANTYWVETEQAKNALLPILKIEEQQIAVIKNTYGEPFVQPIIAQKKWDKFSFIIPTAYYPHKQLEILPQVVSALQQYAQDFQIVLTLPHQVYIKLIPENLQPVIINAGPQTPEQLPFLYSRCHVMLLPTLLEIASAAFPEAMKMKLPIITTDFPFTRESCGHAAWYYHALHTEELVQLMENLLRDKANAQMLMNEKIKEGEQQLAAFPTPETKAQSILACIHKLLTTCAES